MRGRVLSFLFLTEIKNRIILTAISWVFNISIFYLNKESLIFYATNPLRVSVTVNSYFIFSALPDILTLYVDLVLFCSFYITFVTAVYNFSSFFATSLKRAYAAELARLLKGVVVAVVGAPVLVTVALLPAASEFFLLCSSNYNKFSPYPLFFEANLLDFIVFYTNLCSAVFAFMLATLVMFLPILIVGFSSYYVKTLRRFFYCFFCFCSTTLTPPDIVFQLALFTSLSGLFEAAVFRSILKDLSA